MKKCKFLLAIILVIGCFLNNNNFVQAAKKVRQLQIILNNIELVVDSIDYIDSYNQIVSSYQECMNNDNITIEKKNINPQACNKYIHPLFYTLYDFNNDKVPELIIAGTEEKYVLDIYTYIDNELIRVFSNDYNLGNKFTCSIGENNNIYLFEPSGANKAYYHIYKLGDKKDNYLIEIKTYLAMIDNNNIMYYDISGNEGTEISEDQFKQQIKNNYNCGNRFDWYDISDNVLKKSPELFNKIEDTDNDVSNVNKFNNANLFILNSDGAYTYIGNGLKSGEKYNVEGNLLIEQPINIPNDVSIYINGDLILNNQITMGSKTLISCKNDFWVKEKGILDLSSGGNIQVGKDFIFNSAYNHYRYLCNGIIKVSGNVKLKRNFYASEKNLFEINVEEKKVHELDVEKEWFKDTQSFGTLHIVEAGFEAIEIKKIFDAEKIVFDNWDILKKNYYGDCIELKYFPKNSILEKNIPKYVKENIQSGLMLSILDGGIEIPFVNKFLFVSMDEKDLEFYYYNKENKEIRRYTLDIYYQGVKMTGNAGFGLVTYKENEKEYTYYIMFDKKAIIEMQNDYLNIAKDNYVFSSVEEITKITLGGLFKSMLKYQLYSDFYDIYSNFDAISNIVKSQKIVGSDVHLFLEFIIKENDEIKKYRKLVGY